MAVVLVTDLGNYRVEFLIRVSLSFARLILIDSSSTSLELVNFDFDLCFKVFWSLSNDGISFLNSQAFD